MESFSEKEISKQEVLSLERLKLITSYDEGFNNSINRPEGSLLQLMLWVIKNLDLDFKWQPFINNKISIDGSFLKFSEDNGIIIKTITVDAITSWRSDYGDEQFVGAGIYKITKGDLEFYHCGLFHKGNQNEDEVSFFVIVNIDQFNSYLKIRNEYSDWLDKRERESLEIEVIGGEPISYDLDVSWDDVFLPEDLRTKITSSVEGFLNSKELYKKLKVPWKMGMGFWGERGTGKTSTLRLLMSQYQELKPVTIQPGHPNPDELLGEAFAYAERHSPSLLFFEDLQELINTIDIRYFLQLLDGLQKLDGVLTIVTGNDFSNLEDNLKSRPGRFDKFLEFPLPDKDQSTKYLNKYFNNILDSDDINSIVKKSVKNKFTYSHLQELYFNSVFIAIPNGREVPSKDDILLSLDQVINEKKIAESDFEKPRRGLADDY